MVLYFSGTGNSRHCAQELANRLGDVWVDAFCLLRENCGAELHTKSPWVFVTPTYAWQMPRFFADFLRKSKFTGSTDAYFILTCGGEMGNAPACIQALCRELGLAYRGTCSVLMPDNYVVMFGAPEQEAAEKILHQAAPRIAACAACIAEGQDLPRTKAKLADRVKTGPVNWGFYRLFVRDKAFAVSAKCTGCGLCAARCVMRNIRLQDGRPVWGGQCTHCMACICTCPAQAISYGKTQKDRGQYLCPL